MTSIVNCLFLIRSFLFRKQRGEYLLNDLADLMEVKGVSSSSSSSTMVPLTSAKEVGPESSSTSSVSSAGTSQSAMAAPTVTPPPDSGSSLNSSASTAIAFLRSILPKEICASLEPSAEGFTFLTDGDGRMTTVSGGSFLGRSPPETEEGLHIYTLLHPDDHGRFRATQQQVEGAAAALSLPGQFVAASRMLDCRIRDKRNNEMNTIRHLLISFLLLLKRLR